MTSSLEALLMKSRLHKSDSKSPKSSKKDKEKQPEPKYLVFSCNTPIANYKDALTFLESNPVPLDGIKYIDIDIKGPAAQQSDSTTYFEITRRLGNKPYLLAYKPGMYSTIKFEELTTSFIMVANIDGAKDMNDCLIAFADSVDIISVHFYADVESEENYEYESIHMQPRLLASWRKIKDFV